ncbi:NADH-ubiquinone oxidoreductase-F iron-sulfur binding region domain-containing protein [Candidatus Contubernalis alkaliaceticus]|uniref:NADH-ubiquinone oxidoreductase-F iron-sulfur binding region domain-containing protein n=1 Tax=Candidatus Contubernalis alkaliaceticus TaxID=338645 RepID=UPI001F4C09D5|nr:NADH-ubiquinone oxidoreductase-F iron-sulfur binding region domain-containing protein [Candidatus Contubernalis alkalaceticus]UNC93119.1 4Fe-4S binding protein [Candidatus Contubernalis alkalaceticus]
MKKKITSPWDLEILRESIKENRVSGKPCVSVCCGTGCMASGALEVLSSFKSLLKQKGLDFQLDTKLTGCHGFCEQGPLVVITPGDILYCRVQEEDVEEIIEKTIIKDEIIERLSYVEPVSGKQIIKEHDVPFYKKQYRLLMANNGKLVPTEIEDYMALGGYSALKKVLENMTPKQVISEIKTSNLRGRGGGGFPTGVKWQSCFNAPGDPKYLICNADEGDPGCFQDRSILEGNPHSVLEGMIIGAYAVGANQGYIYVRREYPLAIENFGQAIEQAKEYGLLGEGIMGMDFNFNVKINRGGGAFVCGESSASIASIEGKVGEPRDKHTHATEKGLWDKPTVLNNVKTWATVPIIMEKGAEWFASIGTEKSKGTMIFSLTGKVNNTGLAEVPMGMSLRELVFDIGGGVPNGKKLKAVQTGGPSGGCIPENLLDLPVDYEKLSEAGSMMGSGGLIVMDEDTCMVDVAKYFLSFTKDESCGSCFSCREGITRMQEMIDDITRGKSSLEQLELLKELAQVVKDTSMCGLGQTCGNPILSTIRYFEEEYLAHIVEKKCPAGVCRDLISFSIDSELCTGCGRCLKNCPVEAIQGEKKEPHVILEDQCTKCGICREVCKFDAVIKI